MLDCKQEVAAGPATDTGGVVGRDVRCVEAAAEWRFERMATGGPCGALFLVATAAAGGVVEVGAALDARRIGGKCRIADRRHVEGPVKQTQCDNCDHRQDAEGCFLFHGRVPDLMRNESWLRKCRRASGGF